MDWPMGIFILLSVTLILIALLGSMIIAGLNSIENWLETISDLLSYQEALSQHDEMIDDEERHRER